jgi:hypothetical protein
VRVCAITSEFDGDDAVGLVDALRHEPPIIRSIAFGRAPAGGHCGTPGSACPFSGDSERPDSEMSAQQPFRSVSVNP